MCNENVRVLQSVYTSSMLRGCSSFANFSTHFNDERKLYDYLISSIDFGVETDFFAIFICAKAPWFAKINTLWQMILEKNK